MKSLPTSRRFWLLIYALVLVASTLVRNPDKPTSPIRDSQVQMELPEQSRNGLPTGRDILMSYLDINKSNDPDAPVIVLLHGSPVASRTFDPLIPKLAPTYRLLIPDLPGFGSSSKQVASYALKTHAQYVSDWLSALNVEEAHIVGYSMGSGVAIYLSNIAPEHVKSITLLAGIGVQELELSGNYTLNHALHGLQLAGLWCAYNLLPHFGLFDTYALNPNYARNFYESSQRPLRAYLEKYKKPMLILHGKQDRLVPYKAALEHARIVPQSKLLSYDADHMMGFREPLVYTEDLIDFLQSVESGNATIRDTASKERTQSSKEAFGQYRIEFTGTALLWMMLLLALATLVSEDLTCITAGILASHGMLSVWAAIAGCTIGIFIGDALLFFAGKCLGSTALHKAPFKWFLSEGMVKNSSSWLRKRGGVLIIITRFIPGSRLPTYFAAGLVGTHSGTFLFYFALSAFLWTPLLVGLSYYMGSELLSLFDQYEQYALWYMLAMISSILLMIRYIFPLFSWKGRRLLYGKWRRIRGWEFWPSYILYAPVFVYIFGYLIFRYRGITTMTLCNPGMSGGGGLMRESKTEILQNLSSSGAVAPFKALPLKETYSERLRKVQSLIDPDSGKVVIKPDDGARGIDVSIAKSPLEIEALLKAQERDMIAQRYIDGVEYGIFYYREPDQEEGQIFSITEKRYTAVTGDGVSNLEALILNDSRAVCMAERFIDMNADQIERIPKKGEVIRLIELGTHSRGCLFLDANDVHTPELRAAIDRAAKAYEGFHFGRFDIKAKSKEDLIQGRNFQILELNGMTSEATHIYDPKHSIFHAWRTLFKQWRIAYRIGYAHKEQGLKPITHWQFLKLILQSR